MSVPAAIAVDPEVVVPLDVIGPDVVDERRQLVEDPLPRFGAHEADLRVGRLAVLAPFGREPCLTREARLIDRRRRHATGFDPEAELDSAAVRVVGEAGERRRKSVAVHLPRTQTRIEIEVAVRAGAEV